jgi:hypothetical protein
LTNSFKNLEGKEIKGWVCKYVVPVGWDPKADNSQGLSCMGVGKYGVNYSYYLSIPKQPRDGLSKIYSMDQITFNGIVQKLDRSGDIGMTMSVNVTNLNGVSLIGQ